jgi:hypothetical protein
MDPDIFGFDYEAKRNFASMCICPAIYPNYNFYKFETL